MTMAASIQVKSRTLSISKRFLFIVYAIVPVLVFVALADVYIFDGHLKPHLQITALSLTFYLLLFDLPHIMASFVSYADRAYLTHYRTQLLGVPVLVGCAAVLFWYDAVLLFALYVVYTMWHVMRQQAGITALLLRRTHVLHHCWYVLAVVAYTSGFFYVYVNYGARFFDGTVLLFVLHAASFAFLVVTSVYAYTIKDRRSEGFFYFILTSAVVCAGYFFLVLGYPFFALFAIRFVHDVTAFVFYAVHDHNRNAQYSYNVLYRYIRQLGVPLIIITPLLGIAMAWGVRNGFGVLGSAAFFVVVFGLIHYYIEGFMWKRASLHRKQLSFSA